MNQPQDPQGRVDLLAARLARLCAQRLLPAEQHQAYDRYAAPFVEEIFGRVLPTTPITVADICDGLGFLPARRSNRGQRGLR